MSSVDLAGCAFRNFVLPAFAQPPFQEGGRVPVLTVLGRRSYEVKLWI
jgi:hypothetical protein